MTDLAPEADIHELTPDVLHALEVGDQIDAGRVFAGMTQQQISWKVTKISDKGVVTFEATYFGVLLQRLAAKVQPNGEITWAEVP